VTNIERSRPSFEVGADGLYGAEGVHPIAAATSELVSKRQPDGLILSTANVYFTARDYTSAHTQTAKVWRTAQTAAPGQEAFLCGEPGAFFSDIVFANVGGTFYGYFFATTAAVGERVWIKRVPLAPVIGGHTATSVGDDLGVFDIRDTHRNLVTDGSFLYWQDGRAVWRMSVGGDATVLDDAPTTAPFAGLALQGKNLIYASGNHIRYVPTDGSAITPPHLRTIVTAASRVTALHAIYNGVYWGEDSGKVKLKVGNSITTLSSAPGFRPTSISTNESTNNRVWSECGGSSGCRLQFRYSQNHWLNAIGTGAHGVTVTPEDNVFWGDAAGVHRQVLSVT
jgi:hypothetical protein